jgi:hypothetical protein
MFLKKSSNLLDFCFINFINLKSLAMQKINHTGLDRFFNPTVFSNASASYSILNWDCSKPRQSNFTQPVKPFHNEFELKNYSENIGSEVFPIRIVHEPDEILGFNSNGLDSTDSEIGEVDFNSYPFVSDTILCLYLPHTWGNRPSTTTTRL